MTPIPPRAGDSCLLVHLLLKFASSAFCFVANFFSLHHLWFNVYRLSPGARDSDLEDATSSHRICWTEALQRMRKIWTLSMPVCVVVAPTSIAFLQIHDVIDRIYPRTFAVLTFILSSVSLAASYIFIVNINRLDCDEKFHQWESASRQLNTWMSINFWGCLALPITAMAWSIGFCLMTLFSLVWTHPDKAPMPTPTPTTSKLDLAFSCTFTIAMILIITFLFYRVLQLLHN